VTEGGVGNGLKARNILYGAGLNEVFSSSSVGEAGRVGSSLLESRPPKLGFWAGNDPRY